MYYYTIKCLSYLIISILVTKSELTSLLHNLQFLAQARSESDCQLDIHEALYLCINMKVQYKRFVLILAIRVLGADYENVAVGI